MCAREITREAASVLFFREITREAASVLFFSGEELHHLCVHTKSQRAAVGRSCDMP